MKKNLLYICLLLVVAAAAAAYWLYALKTPDVTRQKPHFSIDAGSLAQGFARDATGADKKFNGKVVRVWGTVKSIHANGAVVLAAGASEVVLGLDERHREDAAHLHVGSKATLQGVYSGYEQSSSDPADLLAALGSTVYLHSAGRVE